MYEVFDAEMPHYNPSTVAEVHLVADASEKAAVAEFADQCCKSLARAKKVSLPQCRSLHTWRDDT